MDVYKQIDRELLDDYFILSSIVDSIYETFDDVKVLDTPLGVFFELDNSDGFYLSDIWVENDTETRLVSYRLYGNGDKNLFLRRVLRLPGLSSISYLLNSKELTKSQVKERFVDYI